MIIRMDEPGSVDFYAEGLHIAQQYRKLKEDPHRRLRNTMRNTGMYSLGCLVLSILTLGLGLFLGYDFYILACFTLLLVAAIVSARRYFYRKQRAGEFRKQFVASTLTLDEDGITLANSQTKTLRMKWNDVQFIRVFPENICFMAKEKDGFILSVEARYKDEIIPYVKENYPEVMIIQ